MPSKNVWMMRPSSTEYPLCGMHELIFVRLLAKMEVRRYRVLEKMDEEVTHRIR